MVVFFYEGVGSRKDLFVYKNAFFRKVEAENIQD